MVGRGVLLDVARHKGVACPRRRLSRSRSPTWTRPRSAQGVEVRRGDFVIVRTGQMEDRLARGEWGGYAGGPAPGLAFETCDWIHEQADRGHLHRHLGHRGAPERDRADVFQPWHWVTIPAIGIVHGEIFYLKELAEDCAADRVYEFFFCAPPLEHHRRHRLADQPAGDQVRPARATAA